VRTFIALPLPADAHEMLEELQRPMLDLGADVRWTPIESVHLTVKFLGEIEHSVLPPLTDAIRRVAADSGRFSVRLHGVGAFPNLRAPNILWCGIQGDMERLQALQQGVESACAKLGFPPEERPFAPHLTLGRVRSRRNLRPLLNCIRINSLLECVTGIERINLYQSSLSPRGAIHTILESFPFGGGDTE
jgi:2'-5' RNA ligase